MLSPIVDMVYTITIGDMIDRMALILGVNRKIAKTLHDATLGFTDFSIGSSPKSLLKLHGIGPVTAKRFDALIRLHYDIVYSQFESSIGKCSTVADTARTLAFLLPYRKQESVFMMTYTQEGTPIRLREVHRGSTSKCMISNNTVARYALQDDARSVILFHNHVSRSCQPSGDDRAAHAGLKFVFNIFDIVLVDSIVMCMDHRRYFSLAANKEISHGLGRRTGSRSRKTVQPRTNPASG